ncbi:MAG: RNA-splicing ligase RtcB, partial [Acidobacteriota bacterium]
MDRADLRRQSQNEWWILPTGCMRVPAIIYAPEALIEDMDAKVYELIPNVATLPGVERGAYAR